MKLKFLCTYWGQEALGANEFIDKAVQAGYDGIEINIPEEHAFINELLAGIERIRKDEKKEFVFVAQQVLQPANETVATYHKRFTDRLKLLASFKPDFINSHTGKDYFSFEDNCRMIEAARAITDESGVSIIHETHRGRFSFHAASILPYLEKYPDLLLAGDLSHWCAVSESLLQDQQHIIEKIIPRIAHIHARVGYEHGPQVNDPRAPEWKNHVHTFIAWWDAILEYQQQKGTKTFTILTEFGPAPYMPAAPFTKAPLGDQWKINIAMKNLLKQHFIAG